ncbi:MAG TPA: methyltransferase domain-containing protein [Streptomyces sp.]
MTIPAPISAAAPPRALSFDRAAAQYAAARPGYPPALLDAVEELSGRPLRGSRAVDVGAGTGIATRLLEARGALVTAVEPGPGMAAELHRALPSVPLVRGDGNRLPLAAASADLITYAQSWHWTDQASALPEALRVLRPGGALALWWNVSDHSVPWIAAQGARLARYLGADAVAHGAPVSLSQGSGAHPEHLRRLPGGTLQRLLPWARTVPVETHLANLATHSAFLVRGAAAEEPTRRFFAEEYEHLAAHFPHGLVEERYVVDLRVVIR